MSAPLFLLADGALEGVQVGASLLLDGPEGHHAVTVARMRTGQPVLLADGSGALARCVISEVGKGSLTAEVKNSLFDAVPDPRFTLVQALAKGDRDLLAIEIGTELGVDAVVPWEAERSIVRWRGDRATKAHRKWQHTMVAATKQARRARVPDLSLVADRQAVLARIHQTDLALVLHESAGIALADIAETNLPVSGEVVLIVGPEGGISDDELAAFVGAGAHAVRLGSTALRTSTAGSAALAVLSAQRRWRA